LGALLAVTALPVIASGGVGSLGDLQALAALEVGGRTLAGAIVGKALVDQRFSMEEAVAACTASV
jgi:phosphoribosylformimino-5-aminoimidazole carboxamide ribonucleotide (ProFAR) isomerase